MRRFNFNLQKILDLREHREREAKIELGKAVGALSLIEQRIEAVSLERARAMTDRYSHSMADFQSYDRYIQRLEQAAEKLQKEAVLAELEVNEKRDLFVEASRDRKVLDKVQERRRRAYRKEMFAEETRELDDIGSRSSHGIS
jgi:flagellar FliJ protein